MNSSKQPLPTWTGFAFELALYSAVIVAYYFFVLPSFGAWFKELYDRSHTLFAVMALVVMIGQAVGLELVCTFLVWLVGGRKK